MNPELQKIKSDLNLAYFYIFVICVAIFAGTIFVGKRINKLEKKLDAVYEKVVDQSIKP